MLNEEQAAAARAPLVEALVVVAAAGTGKTTTMLERLRFMLEQGVSASSILVLTFSRRAKEEFEKRLEAVAGSAGACVSTYHAWSWLLVRHHWREAGFASLPTVLAEEQQQVALMRDCLVWEGLDALAAALRGWLFLPPDAGWHEVAATAAKLQPDLYAAALRAALHAHNDRAQQQRGAHGVLPWSEAQRRPWAALPPGVQQAFIFELHASVRRRIAAPQGASGCQAESIEELWALSESQAPQLVKLCEEDKRRGRLPDEQAAAAAATASERRRWLSRVFAAYQATLRRLSLACLSDLPLLARRLLTAGGEAQRWARERWHLLLVDEYQDSSSCMLDLLGELLGESRSVTVVGDDDQSIYSFLCAEPGIFGDFSARFGGRLMCLQTNFRSTAAICAFGTALLQGNQGRAADKAMVPARAGACHPVVVRQYSNAQEEADALAAEVHRLWTEEGVPHSHVCALFRCLRLQGGAPHAPLMDALHRRGIPFVVVGHARLADNAGVAALANYLTLVVNPGADPAFEAAMALPHHALSLETRAAVVLQRHAASLADGAAPSLLDCAEALCGAPGSEAARRLSAEDVEELTRLLCLLRRVRTDVGHRPLADSVRCLLHDSGLAGWMQQEQERLQEASGRDAAGLPCAAGDAGLPLGLQTVLQKAAQLQGEAGEAAAPQAGSLGGGCDLLWQSAAALQQQQQQQASQQQQQQQERGLELLAELLAQVAMEAASDSVAGGGSANGSSGGGASGRAGGGSSHAAGDGWLDGGDDGDDTWRQQQQAQQQAQQPGPGAVTISTIHAAKGLEWPVVLLPFVVDGALPLAFRGPRVRPSDAAAADPDAAAECGAMAAQTAAQEHYAEERRLFHVAATRARDRLLVSYCQPWGDAGQQLVEEAELWQAQSQADPQALSQLERTRHALAQQPCCSSILAATLRRLRSAPAGAQPAVVLQFEGRLPEEDFPGLWRPLAEEQPAGGASQRGGGALGPSNSQRSSQPSIAEQCRQRLAAKGLGVKDGSVSTGSGGRGSGGRGRGRGGRGSGRGKGSGGSGSGSGAVTT